MTILKKGFTLIELLIVVAIIAILAAIAVPNFLEAQTRAKVTRAKADLRSVATALESYAIDKAKYPLDGNDDGAERWPPPDGPPLSDFGILHLNNMLTTPIAYLSTVSMMLDPFNQDRSDNQKSYKTYRYCNINDTYGDVAHNRLASYPPYFALYGAWMLWSYGPDKDTNKSDPSVLYNGSPLYLGLIRYDPTNGTVSPGDVIRCQKYSDTPPYPPSVP